MAAVDEGPPAWIACGESATIISGSDEAMTDTAEIGKSTIRRASPPD